jgi:hypothetical protein
MAHPCIEVVGYYGIGYPPYSLIPHTFHCDDRITVTHLASICKDILEKSAFSYICITRNDVSFMTITFNRATRIYSIHYTDIDNSYDFDGADINEILQTVKCPYFDENEHQ